MRMTRMPCDVVRLMRLRARAHGDDVAAEAIARWQSVDTKPEELQRARERVPLDARIWLSPWPLHLVSRYVESRSGAPAPIVGEALPALQAPVLVALAKLGRIDPAGLALLVSLLRGEYDPLVWRGALGESDRELDDRVTLALYRAIVLRGDILPGIEDRGARVALAARRFRAGDTSELGSLRAARRELDDDALTLPAYRALERAGAQASVDQLRADPQLAVVLSEPALACLRRALRIDAGDEALPPAEVALEAAVSLLSREVLAINLRTPEGHPPLLDLAWFAAGESPRERALIFVEHLLACRGGRCLAVLRGEVCGREAVSRVLSSPLGEPPASHRGGVAAPINAASPHMIKCRDVLWETFAAMAHDEGRSVDDLVEEAMDRYRALRGHLRDATGAPPSVLVDDKTPDAPTTRRASVPPPSVPPASGKAGLRLGSSPWLSKPEPPPSSAPSSEEPTLPNGLGDITKKRQR